MGRIISAKIEFQFDEDFVNDGLDEPMSERDLVKYATDTFIEDIHNFVKYNELHTAVKVEWLD
jgi:predicted secreted protein